jgi:hypothetical protein
MNIGGTLQVGLQPFVATLGRLLGGISEFLSEYPFKVILDILVMRNIDDF